MKAKAEPHQHLHHTQCNKKTILEGLLFYQFRLRTSSYLCKLLYFLGRLPRGLNFLAAFSVLVR